MNVDKFGHHVHKRSRISDLLDLSSIVRFENNIVDLHSATLTGLSPPSNSTDAVNKQYVDSTFCCKSEIKNEVKTIRNEIMDEIKINIARLNTRLTILESQKDKKVNKGSKNECDSPNCV